MMSKRYLGFECYPWTESKKTGSVCPFGFGNRYTGWQWVRLTILFICRVNLTNLHVPCLNGTVREVAQWVEDNRNPTVIRALEIAAEAFGDDDESEDNDE